MGNYLMVLLESWLFPSLTRQSGRMSTWQSFIYNLSDYSSKERYVSRVWIPLGSEILSWRGFDLDYSTHHEVFPSISPKLVLVWSWQWSLYRRPRSDTLVFTNESKSHPGSSQDLSTWPSNTETPSTVISLLLPRFIGLGCQLLQYQPSHCCSSNTTLCQLPIDSALDRHFVYWSSAWTEN
jgi:hypothetical protein